MGLDRPASSLMAASDWSQNWGRVCARADSPIGSRRRVGRVGGRQNEGFYYSQSRARANETGLLDQVAWPIEQSR